MKLNKKSRFTIYKQMLDMLEEEKRVFINRGANYKTNYLFGYCNVLTLIHCNYNIIYFPELIALKPKNRTFIEYDYWFHWGDVYGFTLRINKLKKILKNRK